MHRSGISRYFRLMGRSSRELAEANGARLDLRDNAPGAHFVLTGRSLP